MQKSLVGPNSRLASRSFVKTIKINMSMTIDQWSASGSATSV